MTRLAEPKPKKVQVRHNGREEERPAAPAPLGLGRWMEEMRRDFESWMGATFPWPGLARWDEDWQLARADVCDAGDHYEVTADVPGIPQEKLQVHAAEGRLEIRGEAETTTEIKRKNYRHRELGRRAYYRSVPLPEDADADRAQAELQDGCLTVRVPKRAVTPKGRRIPFTS